MWDIIFLVSSALLFLLLIVQTIKSDRNDDIHIYKKDYINLDKIKLYYVGYIYDYDKSDEAFYYMLLILESETFDEINKHYIEYKKYFTFELN